MTSASYTGIVRFSVERRRYLVAFPQQFLDELVSRNDIVDVVSSYVTLTRKGGNYFGLCPFHNEKTPSFSVSPDKQIYHCFGCKHGGGVISFIMEIENLSFPDAVRFLAKRANMEVPDDGADREASRRRQRPPWPPTWISDRSPEKPLSALVWELPRTAGTAFSPP